MRTKYRGSLAEMPRSTALESRQQHIKSLWPLLEYAANGVGPTYQSQHHEIEMVQGHTLHQYDNTSSITDMQWTPLELQREQRVLQWASNQKRNIAGCACTGNAGNVSPLSLVSDRHASGYLRHAHAVMHQGIVHQRFPLKSVARKTFPAFPMHMQTAILHIWSGVHIL